MLRIAVILAALVAGALSSSAPQLLSPSAPHLRSSLAPQLLSPRTLILRKTGLPQPLSPSAPSQFDQKASGLAARQVCLVRVYQAKAQSVLNHLKSTYPSRFMTYLPLDTVAVTLGQEEIDVVKAIEGVEGVYQMPRELKGEGLSDSAHSNGFSYKDSKSLTTSDSVVIDVLLGVQESESAELEAVLNQWKIELSYVDEFRIPSATKLSIVVGVGSQEDVLDYFADKGLVYWVELRPEFRFKMVYANRGLQSVDGLAEPIWKEGLLGQNQIVGMADSGIDIDSCFFYDTIEEVSNCQGVGAIENCDNPAHRKILSYRQFKDTNVGDARGGHGTVAVGAIIGDFTGRESDYKGAAPQAKLVFDDISLDGRTVYLPDDVETQLLPHAYALGARVYSNSWGTDSNSYTLTARELDSFAHSHTDFLIVVAAGNQGHEDGTVGSPATAKNVLSVGAGENTREAYEAYDKYVGVGQEKRVDNLADYSSRGPTSDGRIKPDVVCTGDSVMSAYSDGVLNGNQCCDEECFSSVRSVGAVPYKNCNVCKNRQILQMSEAGTSVAAPVCAGAAAIIRQYFVEGYHVTGAANKVHAHEPSASLVKAMLIHSGQPMHYSKGGDWILPATLPQLHQGYGRVVLEKVLWFGEQDSTLLVRDRETLEPSELKTLCFSLNSGKADLKVSLVWTDPPGSPTAGRTLVQDLDLVVMDSDGHIHYGNGGSVPDEINNSEQVTIKSPASGEYKVIVMARELPEGAQNYSLVVTGDMYNATTCPAPSCPNDCSDHGICKLGNCSCYNGPVAHTGTSCSGISRPIYTNECSTPQLLGASPYSGELDLITVTSNTGSMVLDFISDNSVQYSGFLAMYTDGTDLDTSVCQGNQMLTHSFGFISNGAEAYNNKQYCSWTISPPNASSVILSFQEFDIEQDWDFVYVHSCEDSACAKKIEIEGSPFTGGKRPPVVQSTTGHMLIVFTSDGSGIMNGFKATYASNTKIVDCTYPAPKLTSHVGFIRDAGADYSSDVHCGFHIAPVAAKKVYLNILNFKTEAVHDRLDVFSCGTEIVETTTAPPAKEVKSTAAVISTSTSAVQADKETSTPAPSTSEAATFSSSKAEVPAPTTTTSVEGTPAPTTAEQDLKTSSPRLSETTEAAQESSTASDSGDSTSVPRTSSAAAVDVVTTTVASPDAIAPAPTTQVAPAPSPPTTAAPPSAAPTTQPVVSPDPVPTTPAPSSPADPPATAGPPTSAAAPSSPPTTQAPSVPSYPPTTQSPSSPSSLKTTAAAEKEAETPATTPIPEGEAVVAFSVSFEMDEEQFREVEGQYIEGVAETADVEVGDVTVTDVKTITERRRALSAVSVEVETEISVAGMASEEAASFPEESVEDTIDVVTKKIVQKLSTSSLSEVMQRKGLPVPTMTQGPRAARASVPPKAPSESPPAAPPDTVAPKAADPSEGGGLPLIPLIGAGGGLVVFVAAFLVYRRTRSQVSQFPLIQGVQLQLNNPQDVEISKGVVLQDGIKPAYRHVEAIEDVMASAGETPRSVQTISKVVEMSSTQPSQYIEGIQLQMHSESLGTTLTLQEGFFASPKANMEAVMASKSVLPEHLPQNVRKGDNEITIAKISGISSNTAARG